MRLIDADALMKTLIHHSYHVTDYWNCTGAGMFLFGIEQAINEQPTIDAVQVIRCKDCKYYRSKSYGHYCENDIYVATGEEFCSQAERRGQYDTVD